MKKSKKNKIDQEQFMYWAIFFLFSVLLLVLTQIWLDKQLSSILNFQPSRLIVNPFFQVESERPAQSWQIYTDSDFRMRFRFPANWVLDSENPDHLVLTDAVNKLTCEYLLGAKEVKR